MGNLRERRDVVLQELLRHIVRRDSAARCGLRESGVEIELQALCKA